VRESGQGSHYLLSTLSLHLLGWRGDTGSCLAGQEQGSGDYHETLCPDPSGGSQLLSDKEMLVQGGPVQKQ